VTGSEWDLDDVLVRIEVGYAVGEQPLTAWMATGPGRRSFTAPESARSRSTGEALPLTVIPLEYRNDRRSRALIAAGNIASPWRDLPWDSDHWGEPPCEVRGPRPFNRSVANPEHIDHLAAVLLRLLPPNDVDAQAARRVLAQVPQFEPAAPAVVRWLAAQERWDELNTIVQLAAAAALVDVAAALCEVLESDARPPHPGSLVDALGQLQYDPATHLLVSLVGQFVYAHEDLPSARRCLRALAAIRKPNARYNLTLISWGDWPAPIAQWADQELEATGQKIHAPGPGPD
jgi:hypothetical protein